ncbi:MAG TPA: hypothetical protein VLC08_04100 [Chitinolyticbacter sp.]|nr:hypothetical protein [Chitinolyticbacter sp.]
MRRIAQLSCAALLLASALPAVAAAGFRVSVAPIWQSGTQLEHEKANNLLLNAGYLQPQDEGWSLGLAASYQYSDWQFNDPSAWHGAAPWGTVHRASVGVNLGLRIENGWQFNLTPSINYAGERDADNNEALGLGLSGSASKAITPALTLGLGIGVFDALEETRAYPYLVVNWDIDQHWRLANPLSAGPAGPAGLELSYRRDRWDVGAGGAYRSFRFRLAGDNAGAPGGIGEEQLIPVYLRFGYAPTRDSKLDVYLGAGFNSQFSTEDADGNLLTRDDLDTVPLFAIQFGGQF